MFVPPQPLGQEMSNLRQIASLLLVSALLTACGGGGGSSSDSSGSNNTPPSIDDPSSNPEVPVARASFSWSAPTQRQDGSELDQDDIAGYELYHMEDDSGNMDIIEVDGDVTEYELDLAAGSHEFGIAVVDVHGIRSPISDMQSIEVN